MIIFLLAVGFIILIGGANLFVTGSSDIAKKFRVSKFTIGITVVAIGTSLPEFAITSNAIITKSSDLILSNLIGSNIINILIVIGLSALINPIKLKSNIPRKELPLLILISSVFVLLILDNSIFTRNKGMILFIFLLIFIKYLFTIIKNNKENEEPKYDLKKDLLFIILGLGGIVIGSNLVVDKAVELATILKVEANIIAVTIIAIGTSLPEIVTAIVASLKKENDMLLGNVIGSNIFNIGLVLGLSSVLFGNFNITKLDFMDLIIFLISPLLLFIFSIDKKITKLEGLLFIILFILYYIYIIGGVIV